MNAASGDSVLTAVRDDVLSVSIDEHVYSREALLRTCYWFTERAYLYITRPRAGIFDVQIRLKQTRPTLEHPEIPKVEEIVGEFLNQLLDYQMRQEIDNQTGAIRELLIAKAFAEAGVLEDEPPGDPSDPVEAGKQALVQLMAKE
jgi:His-Xaa-Ser system protein HxsD